jgi:hypothetical protein
LCSPVINAVGKIDNVLSRNSFSKERCKGQRLALCFLITSFNKKKMTFNTPILYLLFSVNFLLAGMNTTFYNALYSDSLETIESALEKLDREESTNIIEAYKGGLTMKKSDYLKSAAKKIATFKAGHKLLESAIKAEPNNVEYRFIRLTIQENAPKILKYNKNITEDKALILKGYKKMNSKTRAYVLDYAKQSNILTLKDFE